MSGTDSGLTAVEQHLGDRLAALVDGELGDDARDRVLSHLATCHGCKTEADAQRQLKNVFADTAPPPPSDGLLARLQGLPVSGEPRSEDRSKADGPPSGSLPAADAGGRNSPLTFDYLPTARGTSALRPEHGFPIHAVPHGSERGSTSRSRRFAFVAAGAFSVAALALSGPLNSVASGGSPVASGERGKGTAAGAERGASTSPDREVRRRAATGSTGTSNTTRQRSAPVAAPATPRTAMGPAARSELATNLTATGPAHPLARRATAFTPELIRPPVLAKPLSSKSQRDAGAVPGQSPTAAVPSPTSAVPGAP
ncbi:zf-HC2 domain-containing protein [Streptomyces oceani]|uniref:zf-HC2 domain-containing protein n=1 Tax=Streptomyces oceani TaxID=1075402 RepID=UPI0008731BEE|nr:zf-HC2 domain-containing protein [Streptomyces oceani]